MKTVIMRRDIPEEKLTQYWCFIEGLRLAGSSYTSLKKEMPSFVDIVDEVLISFGESMAMVPQLIEVGIIPESMLLTLKKIDSLLESLDITATLSEEEVLNHSQRLESMALARRLLSELGENIPVD